MRRRAQPPKGQPGQPPDGTDVLFTRRRVIVGAALTAAAVAAPAAIAGAATLSSLGSPLVSRAQPLILGVNSHALYGSTTAAGTQFSLFQGMGSGWVRIDINWNTFETSKGVYRNLQQLDAVLLLAHNNNLQVLCTVLSAPQWANGSPNPWVVPKNPLDYAHFLGMLVSRYGDLVAAWEIWNEPNGTFLVPNTPAAYMSLVKPAHAAIKAARPSALVVSGALAWPDARFLAGCYRLGLAGATDRISIHTYPPATPTPGLDPMLTFGAQLGEIWGVMLANGSSGANVWITEIGWSAVSGSTAPPGCVTLSAQAALTSQYLTEINNSTFLGAAFLYCGTDVATGGSTVQQHYGLFTAQLTPKPVVASITRLGFQNRRPVA